MTVTSTAPIVILGNPAENRTAFFQQALQARGLPPAEVISYLDLAADLELPAKVLSAGGVVRIESPGRDFAYYRQMLRCGAEAAAREEGPRLSPREIEDYTPRKGELLFPRQWYLGFRALLEQMERATAGRNLRFTISPDAVAVMFCKRQTHRVLRDAGLPVPATLGPVSGFDELLAAMERAGMPRVFVKLAHGSAASGTVALAASNGRFQAYSTVEMVEDGGQLLLFNSRRQPQYRDPAQVKRLIDALCRHRTHVEAWVPKAGVDGCTCDLRVLVINGEPAHAVLRKSHTPITNLHLGGQRDTAEPLRARMSPAAWAALEETCRKTSSLFVHPLQVALDIAVTPDFRRHYVLEVNAFGDLLQGITHEGLTTYEQQVEALEGWMDGVPCPVVE